MPDPTADASGPIRSVAAVVFAYVVAGLLWIFATTPVADALAATFEVSATTVELVKGVGFVLATAGILWVSLRRWQRAHRDAARRSRADLELRERRFRNLAEQTEGSVYRIAFQPELHLEYISPQFEELTGFSAQELREDPGLLLRHVHPDDRDRLGLISREDPTTGPTSPAVSTFRFRRADGAWVWLEDHHTPEVGPDGRITADQGITFDVTTRREEEESRARALEHEQQASEHLRRAVEAHQTFLTGVSHELRTPLTSVMGIAATLRSHDRVLTPSERHTLLERLLAKAERLQRLLDDLLDLDRLQRGVLDLHVTADVDLAGLLGRITSELDAPDHRLQVDVPATTVDVDVAKVERIIDNLLRNAVRHTPPGTTVSLAATVDADALLLQVEDDGPGLGPDPDDLFELFHQGASASSSPNPGTGIGLALVRDFTALHGGEVWYEEVEPTGARFVVRLPQGRREQD